ncbi:hypothetical protein JW926_05490, partial [Candidatus Sumerlaeota bacterium]|nr:hypothetical protein [Candidatus Sumerlaeota bacterium]
MYVGGLVGYNDSQIYDSYANVHVISPGTCVGGLAGANSWWIERCYATGKIDAGNVRVGGLVGGVILDPGHLYWIADAFYDTETTGKYNPGHFSSGYPKTTIEMMTPSTFTNWDFDNIWFMVPGKSYPVLKPERYVGVDIAPAFGIPNPKPSLPVEFTISFEEPVRNFTFDDLDFSSSTLLGIQGTLEIEDAPTTVGIMDCFTTWTLTITDSATSYGLIVVNAPLGSAMNAANYPSAASQPAGIYILPEHLWGDMNGDGVVNSEDRNILISVILDPLNGWKGVIPFDWSDLNEDGTLDIADIVALILSL